jgi:hypothetical protein
MSTSILDRGTDAVRWLRGAEVVTYSGDDGLRVRLDLREALKHALPHERRELRASMRFGPESLLLECGWNSD